MPNVDPVILKLEADLRDYQRDLSQAQRLTDTKLDAIEKRARKMGEGLARGFSLAKTAAIGFIATVGVDALSRAITSGLEYASSLGEVAQQLGVTTNALQEYRFAATQAGLSQEEMDQALGQLTRRIGDAAGGTKAQAEAFQKLGISIKDANGNIIDAGEAIPLIADALQKVESPAERAALLMDLFGKSGQKLEPLLSGGSKAVNELREAARKLGAVLSEDQIQRADETADKLAALKTVLQANIAGAVANNANSILALANALVQIVAWAGKAAEAFTKFKIAQGIFQEKISYGVMGFNKTDAEKAASQRRVNAYNAELARINGTQDKSGAFRDYRASPLDLGGKPAGVAGSGVNVPKVSGGASAGAGRSAADRVADAARIAAQVEDEIARLNVTRLRIIADLTGTAQDKAAAETAALEADRASFLRQISLDKDLSAAQRKELTAARDAADSQARRAIAVDQAEQLAKDKLARESDGNRGEQDLVRARGSVNDRTARDRLETERRLIDLQFSEEEAQQEAILASEKSTELEKDIARAKLARLAELKGLAQAEAALRNQSPLERYLDELKMTEGELNEAFEGIAVDGLKGLNDGIVEAIMGTKSLGDVFKNVANQIIADLLRIAVQRAIIEPLAGALFGGGSGGGGGGLFSSVFGSILAPGGGIGGGLPGRASGGYVGPGQMVRVNEAGSPGRVEGFLSRDGGRIIPLGQMNQLTQGTAGQPGIAKVRLELSGDLNARIEEVSGPVAVEVVRLSAPSIIEAATTNTIRKAGRPTL